MSVSILIPAFNEAGAVRDTVERIRHVMSAADLDHEIIVIDDGSTDDTAEQASVPGVRLVQHPSNAGYGRALKTGLRNASREYIAIIDADGSYPVEMLPALLTLAPRFDMVVGARTGWRYHGSTAKRYGRRALEAMVNFVTGVRVPDVNSGMRVFRKSIALANISQIGNGFSFTTTLTLAMLLEGHFVHYVPIEYHERIGKSKVKIGRDTMRTMQILVMAIVAYNPIKLFLALAYVALLACIPGLIVDAFVANGSHAGLIVGMATTSSVVVFGLGLLADLLRRVKA